MLTQQQQRPIKKPSVPNKLLEPPASVLLINLVWRVESCVFQAGGSIPALDEDSCR